MAMLAPPRVTRGCLLPAAALIVGLAGSLHAQGTAEQREACTPDALKLCSDTIPDIAKTTACMKVHEADLSPRCRAVLGEADTTTPQGSDGGSHGEAAEMHRHRAWHQATAGEDRDGTDVRMRHRQQTPRAERPDTYDEGSAPGREDGLGEGAQRATRDDPADDYDRPEIRRFAPGDGPDERDEAAGGPPDSDERYDGGPQQLGPRAWDGPRYADGGPPDGDGPDRYDRSFGPDESPEPRRGGYGARADDEPLPGRGSRRAQAVIARFCAAGEIDPRTCALTRRALQRQGRD